MLVSVASMLILTTQLCLVHSREMQVILGSRVDLDHLELMAFLATEAKRYLHNYYYTHLTASLPGQPG